MARYYRIQPAGLGLTGHRSETSSGELADGLHVFASACEAVNPDVGQLHRAEYLGDEVVELEAPAHWDNGDVEGVCVDPSDARIVRRWTLDAFDAAFERGELD